MKSNKPKLSIQQRACHSPQSNKDKNSAWNLEERQLIPSHLLYLIIRACTVKLKTMRRM